MTTRTQSQASLNIKRFNQRLKTVAKRFGLESATYGSMIGPYASGRYKDLVKYNSEGDIISIRNTKESQRILAQILNKSVSEPTLREKLSGFKELAKEEDITPYKALEASNVAEADMDSILATIYSIYGDKAIITQNKDLKEKLTDKEWEDVKVLATTGTRSYQQLFTAQKILEDLVDDI